MIALALCILLSACGRGADQLDRIQGAGFLRAGGISEPGQLTLANQPLRGYAAELVQLLASDIGVATEWQRFDSQMELCNALVAGRIDIATGAIATANAKPCTKAGQVTYGPYLDNSAVVMAYRHGRKRPRSPSDLADLRVASATASASGQRGMTPSLPAMQRGLAEIAADRADVSLVTRSLLANMQTVFPRLAAGFDTGRTAARVWVFRRSGSTRLRSRTLLLIRSARAASIRARQLSHRGQANRAALIALQADQRTRLPQLLEQFVSAARRYRLDPHLLSAVGYQESRWRADARSPTGVRGVMMLTRATAKQMGITDRTEAAQSIEGGARYIAYLQNRFASDLSHAERLWFVLASYNLGLGHVRDARTLTTQLGGNSSHWLDVERTLPLLESPEWHAKLKFGFARGNEAQRYVSNIRHFYDAIAFTPLRMRLLESNQ
jgi:membrane-bound lytic murein transglycosylase F